MLQPRVIVINSDSLHASLPRTNINAGKRRNIDSICSFLPYFDNTPYDIKFHLWDSVNVFCKYPVLILKMIDRMVNL